MRRYLFSRVLWKNRIPLLKKEEKWLIFPLIFFLILCYFLYVKGLMFFEVPSASMEPTLKPGDKVIAFKIKEIKRGDVVIFYHPEDKKEVMVKRVIGLPGEKIKIHGGKVYINGKPLEEPYIKEPPIYDYPETKIPPGHYFLLGDNRNNSQDSSIFGPVPRELIFGKDIFIYWPPSRWGRIE
ncbi:MAG TPA: signal peptidase I [bacterium]|nr:signal peptidase I [bacterium]HEX68070.1 signal peptidase I [bacterium]